MSRDRSRPVLPEASLAVPDPDSVTPHEACGLTGMLLAYLQFHVTKNDFCNPVELTKNCEDIVDLGVGASRFLTLKESYELHRRVPKILQSVYACVKQIKDVRLNEQFKMKEWLFAKKKDLMNAGCEMIGTLATSGQNAGVSGGYDVDFENPCLASFKSSDSRRYACFKTGEEVCKALSGKVELENLIPPGIYDASLAEKLPVDLPEYLRGSLDGATDVLKDRTAGQINDLVSRRVMAKAGGAGTIALATITAASKQIYQAYETGNNDWAHCLGTDNAGACFHKLFLGGVPESKPLARPAVVNGHEQIDCCSCSLDLYQDDGVLEDTKLREDDYLSPIENGDFGKSLCHQQEGTQHEKFGSSAAGFSLYFKYRNCQKVTVAGRSCALTAGSGKSREPVRVLKEEKPTPRRQDHRMSAAREKGPRARLLYAPGARPTDPTPKAGQRFDAIYAMPSSLAPRPYRWTRPAAAPKTVVVASARTSRSSSAAVRTESSAPLDPALFDRGAFSAISLPDHGLRDRARQALKHSVEPTRGAMPAPTLARSFPDLRLPVPETATSPEAHAAPAPISGELPPAAIVESPSEIRNVVKDPDVRARARLALRPDEHVRPTGRPPIRPEATAFPKLPEPTLEVRYERPKLTSPPERPAGELPPLPTSVKAPKNRCECRQEWGAWRNQERYLLCVLRKEGSPLLWTMSYLDDAGCRQSCHTMWTDSRSSICYR